MLLSDRGEYSAEFWTSKSLGYVRAFESTLDKHARSNRQQIWLFFDAGSKYLGNLKQHLNAASILICAKREAMQPGPFRWIGCPGP